MKVVEHLRNVDSRHYEQVVFFLMPFCTGNRKKFVEIPRRNESLDAYVKI